MPEALSVAQDKKHTNTREIYTKVHTDVHVEGCKEEGYVHELVRRGRRKTESARDSARWTVLLDLNSVWAVTAKMETELFADALN